jgi:hypothetical protein
MEVGLEPKLISFDKDEFRSSHNIDSKVILKLFTSYDEDEQKDKLLKYHIQDSASFSQEAQKEALTAQKEAYIESLREKSIGDIDDIKSNRANQRESINQKSSTTTKTNLSQRELGSLNNIDEERFKIFKNAKFVENQGTITNSSVFAFKQNLSMEDKALDEAENIGYSSIKNEYDKEQDRIFAFKPELSMEEKAIDEAENIGYSSIKNEYDKEQDRIFQVIEEQEVVPRAGKLDDFETFSYDADMSYEAKEEQEAQNIGFSTIKNHHDKRNDEIFEVIEEQPVTQQAGKLDDFETFTYDADMSYEAKEEQEAQNIGFSTIKNHHDKRNDEIFEVIEEQPVTQQAGKLDDFETFTYDADMSYEAQEEQEAQNIGFSTIKNHHDKRNDEIFEVIEEQPVTQQAGKLDDFETFTYDADMSYEAQEEQEAQNIGFSTIKNHHDKRNDEIFEVIEEQPVTQQAGKLDDFETFDSHKKKNYEDKEQEEDQNIGFSSTKNNHDLARDEIFEVSEDTGTTHEEGVLDDMEIFDKDSSSSDEESLTDDMEIFNANDTKSFEEIETQRDQQSDTNEEHHLNIMSDNGKVLDMKDDFDKYINSLDEMNCDRCQYLESMGFYDSPQRAKEILLQSMRTGNIPLLNHIINRGGLTTTKKKKSSS